MTLFHRRRGPPQRSKEVSMSRLTTFSARRVSPPAITCLLAMLFAHAPATAGTVAAAPAQSATVQEALRQADFGIGIAELTLKTYGERLDADARHAIESAI